MVTIYDIAKETGYSAPTVSKALNGSGRLSEETRAKIEAAAKKMGYEPNVVARSLATKKSKLIGVIYDDTGMNRGFSHPLFSQVLTRFRDCIEQAGYDLVFLSRHFNMSYFAHAKHRCVDGVIVINPATNDRQQFQAFVDEKYPCVSTNTIIEGMCTVISDNEAGAYQAAEYLIQKGHTKVAFISAPKSEGISSAPQERFNGFKRAFTNHQLEVDPQLFEEAQSWDKEGGFAAMERLMAKKREFTAVFAVTDQLAFGVYEYAQKNDLKIPDQISVIGFDDDKISAFVNPPLTTFRQNGQKIAELSAENMLQQLEGKAANHTVRVEAEFVERASVKNLK